MIRPPHAVLIGSLLIGACLPCFPNHADAAVILRPGASATCETCTLVPDTCCSVQPPLHGAEAPAFSPNVLVTTNDPLLTHPYCVTIYDLGSTPPSPLEDHNWVSVLRYHGPGNTWNVDSLGTVFGLTLDEYGNIFVCHTSCYSSDSTGNVFGGGPGAVYRIDGNTGKITTFVRLPNYADPNYSSPDAYPGLGNITYDCAHKQFFVTNMEDGRIYRIKPVGVNGPTGTVVGVFDPLGPDGGPTNYLLPSGTPGWAPLGERLWAVQIHANRLFYSVWAEDLTRPSASAANEIRSVQIAAAGNFMAATDQHELFVPSLPLGNFGNTPFSSPVSDISFSSSGRMLLAEHSMTNETYPTAHVSRLLEFQCANNCWAPADTFRTGQLQGLNSAGGCDYDGHAFTGSTVGRIWGSSDYIHGNAPYTDVIYGFQGFRPGGGDLTNSLLIDADGDTTIYDKTNVGDIEVPGCRETGTGQICGFKFMDLNHNGVHDTGEPAASGWQIQLAGPGGAQIATTDANGHYCFSNLTPGTYGVGEIGVAGYTNTLPANGGYTITLGAGQTVAGQDFGNYACNGGACVTPPPGMVAWWPFDEPAGSTTAADLVHLSPSGNVLQLVGGAAISAGGEVARALCFASELDYARVANAAQTGLTLGTSDFSFDAWVRPSAGGAGPRMIAEKRVLISAGPYITRGWAVYLNGNQLFLEVGNGSATAIYPGPAVPASVWSHFAVSVGRSNIQGRWYVNGAVQGAFNFTPLTGSVTTAADLYLGHASPAFQPQAGPASLAGCVDELEIFNAILPAASVQAIYASGATGKCRDFIRMPVVTTYCKSTTQVTVCFNVCNATTTTQNYHWSASGLPVGAGCSVPGPVTFSPSAGTISVPPGTCSANICIVIPRPTGLTAQGATSCFAVTLVNDSTGQCRTVTSTLAADNTCWCVTPLTGGIVNVPARVKTSGIVIGIDIGNPCATSAMPWRMVAQYESADHADPLEVSLNGLPPGEPVTGLAHAGPNGNDIAQVFVSTPRGYDPNALYSIVFEADTDGDGTFVPLCSVPIQSVPTGDGVSSVPPGFTDSARLSAAPNPFAAGAVIAFTLAQPDDVELGVYDLVGRQVRSLQHGRMAAGQQSVTWDGRDAHGQISPSGIYFLRLRSPRLRLDGKVVKLR